MVVNLVNVIQLWQVFKGEGVKGRVLLMEGKVREDKMVKGKYENQGK